MGPEIKAAWYEWPSIFFGALAGLFAFSKRDWVFPIPIHQDDYNLLGLFQQSLRFPSVRPVSVTLTWLMSALGDRGFYICLYLLLFGFVFQAYFFCLALLRVPESKAWKTVMRAFLFGATIFLFENSFEYTTYTGTAVNLFSGNFALSACLCFLGFLRRDPLRPRLLLGGALCFLLSVFSKEDFTLLPFALVACESLLSRSHFHSHFKKIVFVLLVVGVCGMACLFYNHWAGSPFVYHGSPDYAHSRTISDFRHTLLFYLKDTRFLKTISVLSLLGAMGIAARLAMKGLIEDRRLLLSYLVPVSLIVPFIFLKNHVFAFYAFNWIPILVFFLYYAADRVFKFSLVVNLAIFALLALVSTEGRNGNLAWVRSMQLINGNIVAFVESLGPELGDGRTVNVLGVCDYLNPWLRTDGNYLLGRTHVRRKWRFYCPKESFFAHYFTGSYPDSEWIATESSDESILATHASGSMIVFNKLGQGKLERR